MHKRWAVIVTSLLTSSVALADDAGLLRCRTIGDAALRLACYDALVPSTLTPSTPVPPVDPAATFGRERQAEPSVASPESIDTYILGVFEGWQPRTRIRLANGQVWQVTDDSKGAYRLVDPPVTLRRGMLGSFFLELTGQNRSIKVRRIE